jgi:hypothetical protein
MIGIGVRRRLVLSIVTLPLLAAGSCAVIAQTSVVSGFFNAVTPLLVDHVRAGMGLAADTAGSAATQSYRDLPRGH